MADQNYSSAFDDASSTLTVTGEVDETTGVTLREDIATYSAGFERSIRVDVGGTDYFPSLAVGVLATSQKKAAAAGVDLQVVAADGTIAQRVLAICGLDYQTA